jgi:Lrp/AsnC family transcriptional regulator, leucine-responsive regulatory protein
VDFDGGLLVMAMKRRYSSDMAFDPDYEPDDTDWRILDELQRDGRVSFSELGRRVAMSSPAVADRVRRLEETGIITGYRAVVDPARLGRPITAMVRVRMLPGTTYGDVDSDLGSRPEILEAHHVTGDDCYLVRVAVPTMADLEKVVAFLAERGSTTTSLVFSTPVGHKVLGPVESAPGEGFTGPRRIA